MVSMRDARVAQVRSSSELQGIPLTLDPEGFGTGVEARLLTSDSLKCDVDEGSEVFIGADVRLQGRNNITVIGKDNVVLIGRGTRLIDCAITLRGNNCTFLMAEGCRMGKSVRFKVVGDGSAIVLGASTTIESGMFIAMNGSSIAIGEDCMFSNHVTIRTSDGHGMWDLETGAQISMPAPVVIGHHVWLGNSSRVSKGVRIGDGAIVGQMGMVTQDIDPKTVNVGIPTKSIRTGISWSRTLSFKDVPDSIKTGTPWRGPQAKR